MKITQLQTRDYGYYAAEVKLRWSRAVEGIVAMGYLLCEARMNLTAFDWKRLVVEECPFDLTVACRLIRVAQDQRVTDPRILKTLPPSWDKLYQLMTLPEPAFRQGLDEGTIHPRMTGKEIERLRVATHVSQTVHACPGERNIELEEALYEVLDRFPCVSSVKAIISDPKFQVVEISRKDLETPLAAA